MTDTWVALTPDELPIAAVYEWALDPAAGAVVLFSGTVRDHSGGVASGDNEIGGNDSGGRRSGNGDLPGGGRSGDGCWEGRGEHRTGVTELVYEAYETEAVPRLGAIAAEMRRRWPGLRRVALLHRTGSLGLTESSVVVAVSAPHREAAFEAARFGIDTLKATVPIWKQEHHDGGADWGLQSQPIAQVQVP